MVYEFKEEKQRLYDKIRELKDPANKYADKESIKVNLWKRGATIEIRYQDGPFVVRIDKGDGQIARAEFVAPDQVMEYLSEGYMGISYLVTRGYSKVVDGPTHSSACLKALLSRLEHQNIGQVLPVISSEEQITLHTED